MSQRLIAIMVIVVIVLGGGIYAFKQLMPDDAQVAQGPVYATKEVIRGDITVGVNATGMLNPTRGGGIRTTGDRYYGGPQINYTIDEMLVEEGDSVVKGQVLVRLKSSDLELQIEDKEEKLQMLLDDLCEMTGLSEAELDSVNPSRGITVRAPIAGKVTGLDVLEGDELKLGHVICRIVNDSVFVVTAKIPVAQISKLEVGKKVLLNFPYFNGFMEASVTEINPNPIPDAEEGEYAKGFIYLVTIEGNNPGLVQPGMELRVALPMGENDASINMISSKAKVDGYKEEKKVINRAEAVVTEIFLHEMELVEEGDPIISMSGNDIQNLLERNLSQKQQLESDLRTLTTKLSQLEITSPMDGVVASINKEEGDTVSDGEWFGDVYNTGQMMLWTQVDDIDIVNVRTDAPVEVTVDAVPGEIFTGKVTHVSPMGQSVNGITRFSVNIEIEGGPQLRPGMQANAYIDAGSAENVLLIPMEAVFEEDGRPMVEVLLQDGSVRIQEIKLGLMNDRYAEVKDGLEEGDLVITGSSADILPSQQIKSNGSLLPDSGSEEGSGNNGQTN